MLYRALTYEDFETACAIIESESAELGKLRPFPTIVMRPGAIEASVVNGDIIWLSKDDPRLLIWIGIDDEPKEGKVVRVNHVWAPSERHENVLVLVAEAIADAGWDGLPIRIPTSSTISEIALDKVGEIITIERGGKTALAAGASAARALLIAKGAEKDEEFEKKAEPIDPIDIATGRR